MAHKLWDFGRRNCGTGRKNYGILHPELRGRGLCPNNPAMSRIPSCAGERQREARPAPMPGSRTGPRSITDDVTQSSSDDTRSGPRMV